MHQKRNLSHDEKKASEAAFRGLPFQPKWSNSAKIIYDGIVQALGNSDIAVSEHIPALPEKDEFVPEVSDLENSVETQEEFSLLSPVESLQDLQEGPKISASLPVNSRKESITAGIVKDATPAAKRIGLEIPVGLTNAVWENYVAITNNMSEDLIQSRLQDIMKGVRLRLASLKEAIPFIDVPILLDFPPETIPQLSLTFALFHRDPEEGNCLLLIHPGEIFSPRQNISHN
jgi:hypothetical protein